MKKIKNVFVAIVSVTCLISCSKERLVESPPNFITADVLYTTVEGFDAGLNGLYASVRDERNGLNYTSGFGTIDLRAAIMITGTDNIGAGSNTGGLSTITADWTKNTPADPNIDKLFLWLYKVVSAANTIITRAENPVIKWGAGNKERVLGEARTVRAWAYRHLTYLWGDVPLLTEEVSGENIRTDLVREKVATIRRVMIEDFKYGAENLPWSPTKAGRLTRGVAQTYLSEIYLAVGKPDSALFWANECITKGPYSLVKTRYGAGSDQPGVAFMDMFNPGKTNISDGNTEALWVMQWERNAIGGGENLMRHETTMRYPNARYVNRVGFLTATDARGGRGWSRQTITKQALLWYTASSDVPAGKVDQRSSEFALRKYFILGADDNFAGLTNTATKAPWKLGDTVWLATGISRSIIADPGMKSKSGAVNFSLLPDGTANNNDWPYSLKFAYNDAGFANTTESHQDQIYMRLAETILLRAEAKGRLGNLPGAADDINLLRDRANAKRVIVSNFGATLTTFLDYILDERSRELLVEEHRRYTLLRMGGASFFYRRTNTFNTISKNLALRDTLLPIPQSVIDANLTLKMPQNPGFN
ncbi:RagB/SusD family nutrient uptake outer membrane protein [Pedobacter heparinus]|nr:RagB/SusD family nutrient uptake outer membrane protein [Pedobacter heparinus]